MGNKKGRQKYICRPISSGRLHMQDPGFEGFYFASVMRRVCTKPPESIVYT